MAYQALYALSAMTRNLITTLDLFSEDSLMEGSSQHSGLPPALAAVVSCFSRYDQGASEKSFVKKAMGMLTDMGERNLRIPVALASSATAVDAWVGMVQLQCFLFQN